MSRASFNVDTDTLHAYADGQLGEGERMAVSSWLEQHPDAARLVATWQQQNDALRALFDPVVSEPVPPRLSVSRIDQQLAAQRSRLWRNVAAAVVILGIGVAGGWLGRELSLPVETPADYLIEQALAAHTLYVHEKSHAVEVAADAPNLMTWLSNRLDVAFDAPDLTAQGYRFLGGRLLPGYEEAETGPAAQLMYQNAADERLTLYVTGPLPGGKTAYYDRTENGVHAYYWATPEVTCTLVASLPDDEIKVLGKAVFEQLTRRPDPNWDWQR